MTIDTHWRATAPQAGISGEIVRERAAVLGRIAGMLDSLLDELARLAELASTAAAEELATIVDEHEAIRRMALRYRWYLVVQREANGLHGEADVVRLYPVPSALRLGVTSTAPAAESLTAGSGPARSRPVPGRRSRARR